MNDNGGKGATPGERFRGWLPVPLTLEGMKASREVADKLATLDTKATNLYTSDIVRAVQSAEEVAQALHMVLEPKEELRDWNLGIYVGKPVKDVLPEVLKFIDTPSKAVSQGEPYQHFLDRCVPFLREIIEQPGLCIAVTHARVTGLIKALAANKGKYPDKAILKKPSPISPSGIMVIDDQWRIMYQSEKDKD